MVVPVGVRMPMIMAVTVGVSVTSVVVTLGGCALFTNGMEWLGKRLKVPEGAIGSVFAAVGTTLMWPWSRVGPRTNPRQQPTRRLSPCA